MTGINAADIGFIAVPQSGISRLPENKAAELQAGRDRIQYYRSPEGQAELEASRQAQLAKQNAQKAETVYRVGNEIVGVNAGEGGGITLRGAAQAASSTITQASKDAETQGLRDDALRDFVSNRVTEKLQQVYGSALKVEHYNAGQGPTMGQINAEMFGTAATGSAGSSASRIAYNPDVLSLLSGA